MAAYSVDLRERSVEAVERDASSKREIARLFGVHESFLYKLLRQKRERGDLTPLPHCGGAQAKLTAKHWQQVASWIATAPDATLAELQEQVQRKLRVWVGLSTIWRGGERLGVTRKKKSKRPAQANAQARATFQDQQPQLPGNDL